MTRLTFLKLPLFQTKIEENQFNKKPTGGAANIIWGELPTVDTQTMIYTTIRNFAMLAVYRNGLRQCIECDYIIVGPNAFQFKPETGIVSTDKVIVDYVF